MPSQAWFAVLVALVGAERVAELVRSRRGLAWSLARGGVEYGRGHYPVMVALHTGLLAGAVVEVLLAGRSFVPVLGWPMLGLTVAAQALRWWCILALGPRWNTRVVVVPGLPLVRRGPYAKLRHPNYLAVVVEGFALPLVHTAWVTAAVFSAANLVLLAVRVLVENGALARAVGQAAGRPGGLPGEEPRP